MAEQDDDEERRSEQGNGLHDRLMDTLLAEIERERYPSNHMLDLLETHMAGMDRERIANVLLDNLAGHRYPSHDMVSRIARLVG